MRTGWRQQKQTSRRLALRRYRSSTVMPAPWSATAAWDRQYGMVSVAESTTPPRWAVPQRREDVSRLDKSGKQDRRYQERLLFSGTPLTGQ